MKVIKEAIAGTLESSEIHELEAHVERIERRVAARSVVPS
jgi:citrate lyase gamma subunit